MAGRGGASNGGGAGTTVSHCRASTRNSRSSVTICCIFNRGSWDSSRQLRARRIAALRSPSGPWQGATAIGGMASPTASGFRPVTISYSRAPKAVTSPLSLARSGKTCGEMSMAPTECKITRHAATAPWYRPAQCISRSSEATSAAQSKAVASGRAPFANSVERYEFAVLPSCRASTWPFRDNVGPIQDLHFGTLMSRHSRGRVLGKSRP